MATKKTNEKFNFIDFQAGIGGFHIAVHSAGGKCMFESDWEKYKRKLRSMN